MDVKKALSRADYFFREYTQEELDKADRKIKKARYNLITNLDFMKHIALNVPMIPVEHPAHRLDLLGGMAVDKRWRLYYQVDVILTLPIGEIEIILQHEYEHLYRKHFERLSSFPLILANYGGDLEINDDLTTDSAYKWSPFVRREDIDNFRKSSLMPEKFGFENGLTAEEYIRLLENKKIKIPISVPQELEGLVEQALDDCGIKEKGQNKEGKPSYTKKRKGERTDYEVEGKLSDPEIRELAEKLFGSSVDGRERDYEVGDKECRGLSEAEKEIIRRQTAKSIKSIGNAPAGLLRTADEILEPKVRWDKVFRTVLSREISLKKGNKDYTFKRPSRRYDGPFILPSMVSPEIKVGVAIDCSASMDDKDLAACLGEVKGIIKSVGYSPIKVVTVDTKASVVQRVFDPKSIKLFGGGGTEVCAGLKQLEGEKIDVAVLLTDGYTPWDEQNPLPGTKVVTVVIKRPPQEYLAQIPSWTKYIVRDV